MLDFIKNNSVYLNKYKTHSEAIIISCFFNPHNSEYRKFAFDNFYDSIKHLNHKIIECVIGESSPQLPENSNISRIYTKNLLWHKETLLNKIISELPKKYKYIFWVDADVIFTNKNWLVEGVESLQSNNIIQPFDYCVHLEKDELEPEFSMKYYSRMDYPNAINQKIWKSFCSNFAQNKSYDDLNYNNHGHVGFAWGARREILEATPLYDRALIGGADHIIAHAAAGQIAHPCITKSFTDNIDEVNEWSKKFYSTVDGKIGYVKGHLYHIWHGDIEKRQYLKRIQDFTKDSKKIVEKDSNGLYVTEDDTYVKEYFNRREVSQDSSFLDSLIIGYAIDSSMLGTVLGGNPVGAILGDILNSNDDSNDCCGNSCNCINFSEGSTNTSENFS